MLNRYTQKNLTWIDLVAPAPEEVRHLMREFGFNPLIAQELLSVSAKSKVERYSDELFAVFHFPTLRGERGPRAAVEIDFLVGKNFLITARYENVAALSDFAKAFEVEAVLSTGSTPLHGGHLLSAILKNLYRSLLLEADAVKTRLAETEEVLFDGNEKDLVIEISRIGRAIHDFRQALLPHREMLKSLEAPAARLFGQEFSYYMRGIEAEYARALGEIDALRESAQELRETNNSMLSAKQNEVIKTFSVLAFVFIPVSIIMGLYEMGLPGTPFMGQANFWTVLGAILAIALVLFAYFKKKNWL